MNTNQPFVPDKQRDRLAYLYDTYTMTGSGAVPATINFFGNIVGQSNVTKVHTNMTQAFQLPANEAFYLLSMRVGMINNDLADVLNWQQKYYASLIIGGADKAFLEGPLHLFPGGTGVDGFAATTATTTTIAAANNGMACSKSVFELGMDWGIWIPGGIPFKVRIEGATFNAVKSGALVVILEGIKREGVQ